MLDVLHIAIFIALGVVVAVLFTGFYALFRGGSFGRSWSNRLMRLRVAVQFVAIVIIMATIWLMNR